MNALDLDRDTCGFGVRECVCGQCRCRECWETREECECGSQPEASPQPCDRCVRAYEDCAPHRGWCASCAPDGVLIGVLCACGGERLLEGQERCDECEEAAQ